MDISGGSQTIVTDLGTHLQTIDAWLLAALETDLLCDRYIKMISKIPTLTSLGNL